MSGQEQETRGLVANGSALIRYDGSSPNDIQPSAQANRDRFDDAHLAMLDPDSLSTGRKRLFVAGMILASFLAALDLTGRRSLSCILNGLTDFEQWLPPVCQQYRASFRVLTGKHG